MYAVCNDGSVYVTKIAEKLKWTKLESVPLYEELVNR
jgi:hypothetical protein